MWMIRKAMTIRETWGKMRDQKNVRYFKFIKGFSVIGYGIIKK